MPRRIYPASPLRASKTHCPTQSLSSPSPNLLFKANAEAHHTFSRRLSLLVRDLIHSPSQLSFQNFRLNLIKRFKSSEIPINTQFNIILSEFPQYTKSFPDGSKTREKTVCSISLNSNLHSFCLPNSASVFTAELTSPFISGLQHWYKKKT